MFHVGAESAHWDSPGLRDLDFSPLPVSVSAAQADVLESSLEETTQAMYDEGNVMMLFVAE